MMNNLAITIFTDKTQQHQLQRIINTATNQDQATELSGYDGGDDGDDDPNDASCDDDDDGDNFPLGEGIFPTVICLMQVFFSRSAFLPRCGGEKNNVKFTVEFLGQGECIREGASGGEPQGAHT